MAKRRIYPLNLDTLLKNYEESDQRQIITEYNRIYDLNLDLLIENIETSTDNNLKDFEEHNYLLSAILQPFLTHMIRDYDLLFVDPLYFCKKLKEIDDIPTFDFVLGQKEENVLKTVIFGEVKGQSPKTEFNIAVINEYMNNQMIRDKLINYIRNMDTSILISHDLKFEFVLVCKGLNTPEFIESITEKQIPFILWSVHLDFFENIYRVIIHEKLFDSEEFVLKHDSRYLVDYFRSNRIKYRPILEFTHSLDTNSILVNIRDDYNLRYGTEITDDNLTEIIIELGLGNYYDDSRIIPYLINRLKKKGLELKIIKERSGNLNFKKIDLKEKMVDYLLKRKVQDKNKGKKILQEAIKNLNLPRKGLYRFIDKKNT